MSRTYWMAWPLAAAIALSPVLATAEPQPPLAAGAGLPAQQTPAVPTAATAPAAASLSAATPAVFPLAAPAPAHSPLPESSSAAPAPAAGAAASAPAQTAAPAAADATNGRKSAGKATGKTFQRSGICNHLDDVATKYKLPPLFFARLIWQESRFNPYAVSPAGAQGIAQFMPGTAAIWGLDDPFEPGEALLKSAQLLSYLQRKLGNLGFAAAGYNAGSQRVVDWLAGSGYMPLETRNYVYAITGHSIEEWAEGTAQFEEVKLARKLPASACEQLSIALKRERAGIRTVSLSPDDSIIRRGRNGHLRQSSARPKFTPPPPWGVQLAGSFSRGVAMKQFNALKQKFGGIIGTNRIVLKSSRQEGRGSKIFHRVRVGTNSRAEAETLCSKLRTAGGSCVVMKN